MVSKSALPQNNWHGSKPCKPWILALLRKTHARTVRSKNIDMKMSENAVNTSVSNVRGYPALT